MGPVKNLILSILILALCLGCSYKAEKLLPSKPLVIAVSIPLGEIGPYTYEGLAANLSDLVYQLLLYYQPNGELSFDYALAKALQWNDDKTKLKVSLKAPLAESVVESFHKLRQKDLEKFGPFFQGLKNLEAVRALSPTVVEFQLARFDRTFLYALPLIRVVDPNEADGASGPFRLLKQDENEIVLERKVFSPTKVNQIIARRVDSPRRSLRELVAGNVDIVALINQGDYEVLDNLEELELNVVNIELLYMLIENQARHKSPLWKQANQLFPREEFIEIHGYKNLRVGRDSIPKNQRAKHGIQEDWVSKGAVGDFKPSPKERKLSFRTTNTMDLLLAKYVQRTLQNWGMNIVLNPVTPPEYHREVYQERSFDLSLIMIRMSQVLMTHYIYFHSNGIGGGQNYASYSNPLLDKLLDKARYALDDDEAKENFKLAMKYFWEDPPGIFLYWLQVPLLYRKSCSGFEPESHIFFLSLENARCEPSVEN